MKRVLGCLFALMLCAPVAWSADAERNIMQGQVTNIVAAGIVIDGEVFQLTNTTRLKEGEESDIRGKSAISSRLPLNSEVLYEVDSQNTSQLIYIEVLVK